MTMHVVSLRDGAPHDPHPVLAGPWRYLRLLELAPGAAEELEAGDVEYAAFVVDGAGLARAAGGEHPLRRGTSLVLLRGTGARIEAGDAGLVVFLEAIDAPR